MNNIDVFHDPGHARLKYLLTTYPKLAEFIGTDKTASSDDADSLPDSAFADSIRRYFPIHSPKLAALSAAYAQTAMKEGIHVPAEVVDNIKMACEAYSVPDACFVMVSLVEKTASADDYLFPEKRLYLIRDAEEIKTAEARLIAERSKLLPENRVAAFGRLFKKATQLSVELSPTSYKYAGLTETDAGKLCQALRARSEAATGLVKEAFSTLADTVHRDPRALSHRETRIKLAGAIAELDKAGDVVKHYDRGVQDPIETVFNTEKVAYAGIDLGTSTVPMTKLMSLDPEFYGDVLGSDFVPDICTGGNLDSAKIAEVLPTLPRDMKHALSTAISRI